MAWPKSPLTAYVANNVPVIKADDLNAFQDWINAFTNDTVSILGLNLDGVGGNAKTAVPSAITWTNTAGGGGNPARTVALLNKLFALNVPKAWLFYVTDGGGGFTEIDGGNILSVDYPGGNVVRVTLAAGFANTTFSAVPHAQQGANALFPIANRISATQIGLDFSKADHSGAGAPAAIDPATQPSIEIKLHVFGRQTTA